MWVSLQARTPMASPPIYYSPTQPVSGCALQPPETDPSRRGIKGFLLFDPPLRGSRLVHYVADEEAQKHILVVEDMDSLREHIAEVLADLGDNFVAETAVDGIEALEKIDAREEPFDVVITDITMPRMDGEALLQELRRRRYSAPMIVLTAHGQDDYVLRCLNAGACDYLVKPVGVDDLLLAANTALSHGSMSNLEVSVDYDPHGWFEVSGGSDYAVLYRYRKFLSLLSRFRFSEETMNEIRLVIEELGRNAIEWGNRMDPDKKIRLACRVLPGKVIVLISDEGEGFQPDEVPDPSEDPVEHVQRRMAEGKRLGGYGVHLVKNLADKVTWNAAGNTVMAIKYLEGRTGRLARRKDGVVERVTIEGERPAN